MDASDSGRLKRRLEAVGIHYVAETDSTNADLEGRPELPHGSTLVAGRQRAGRGRLGRSWWSGSGNLTMSVLLRPQLAVEQVPLICLGASVALVESVDCGARIKWPNDVHVGGKKLAGILATRSGDTVVVGIGLNVASHPPDLPATSLARLGGPTDLVLLAASIRDGVLSWCVGLQRGPDELLSSWRAHSATLGERVRIGAVVGRAIDIEASGALLVRTESGTVRVLAGDVEMISG